MKIKVSPHVYMCVYILSKTLRKEESCSALYTRNKKKYAIHFFFLLFSIISLCSIRHVDEKQIHIFTSSVFINAKCQASDRLQKAMIKFAPFISLFQKKGEKLWKSPIRKMDIENEINKRRINFLFHLQSLYLIIFFRYRKSEYSI